MVIMIGMLVIKSIFDEMVSREYMVINHCFLTITENSVSS